MSELLTVRIGTRSSFLWEVIRKACVCQRCGAPIWFVLTHNQKAMPVDEPDEDCTITHSHFDTCSKQPRRV